MVNLQNLSVRGDKCFILQLGSNSHEAFLLILELTHGHCKGSIVVPEGKTGSGRRGFGLHLRKVLAPESLSPKQAITVIPFRDALKSFALVVAGKQDNNSARGDEGKNKTVMIQNTNLEQPGVKSQSVSSCNNCEESILGQRELPGVKILSESSRNNHVTCKESTLGQREQLGAKILSTIDGIENKVIKAELTLDLFLRMEREIDGSWAIVWFEVKEVGPKVVQPKKPTIQNFHNISTSNPFNNAKPKPVWRPCQSQSLANPVHRQRGNFELVALGVSESRALPPVERQVDVSSSVDGLTPMRVLDVPATRKESVSRCSSILVNPNFGKAVFFGFTGSGAEETQGLGRWDAGFTDDMVISLAVAGIEPPILKEGLLILCQQPWVVHNRFSPLSVLGNGLEAEVGEGEAHEEEQSSGLVDSIGEFQPDFGLHILPWETSGVDDSGCDCEEKDNWVLDCEPLS